MYPSRICIFLKDLSISFTSSNAFQKSQCRKIESVTTYLYARVDDIRFFRQSNTLLLGTVLRVVNSSQQVIMGDSKSLKTNLNTVMTNSALCENLFEPSCSCIEFCNCLSLLNKLPLLSSATRQLF